MAIFRRLAQSLVLVLGLVPTTALADQPGVVVNGEPLSMQEVLDYGVDVPPGRYWYDQVSGFWGAEGRPSVGQISPGLALGGALQADASSGDTGVFINGREIHMLELLELRQIFGEVPLGRYWLGADGVGGVECGPASFNLAPAPSQADSGGSGVSRTTSPTSSSATVSPCRTCLAQSMDSLVLGRPRARAATVV